MSTHGPLIIQSDHMLLLEVQHSQYADCRDFLVLFTELVKSPEFIHTYKITPLSLWNAAALKISLEQITSELERFSKYAIPANVLTLIKEWYQQYGKLILEKYDEQYLQLSIQDENIYQRIVHDESLKSFWKKTNKKSLLIASHDRGNIKQALIKIGYPINDLCGYLKGDNFEIKLRDIDLNDNAFTLRKYQYEAIESFYQSGNKSGGNGIIVLPCGSGKTIIGLGIIAAISNFTLIMDDQKKSRWKKIIWRTIAVIFGAYVILVIARVPHAIKKQKTDAAVAKIHATKLTLDDVMGKNLPPDPGADADTTVQGVDANHNGIRDDVELAIFKEYPTSAKTRAALLQYALALQLEVVQVIVNRGTVDAVADYGDRSSTCVADTLVPRKSPESLRDDIDMQKIDGFTNFIENKQLNTDVRKKVQHDFYQGNLKGYDKSNKPACDLDISLLPN